MSISQPFVTLAYQQFEVCSCCGIDQLSTAGEGQPGKRYFLIPDKASGAYLCPVCFFARNWQDYGPQMHGQLVFTDTPQSILSLTFYFRQIASRASLQKIPSLLLSIEKMLDQVLESSNAAVKKHFAPIEQEMVKSNTAYLSHLSQEIAIPHYILQRIRYIPHSADFQILTFSDRPSEQLTNFLEATKFHYEMSSTERGFISQAIAWFEEGRAAVHL